MQSDPPPTTRPWLFPAGMTACVLGLVFACYWPALHGELLWDDGAHVTRASLQSLAGLGRIWTDVQSTQQYYPVLHSAFWLEHRLWGEATLGYHLVNIFQHAANCCLLALLLLYLRRLPLNAATENSPQVEKRGNLGARGPWMAAALFAVHPVCVESVAWISEQKNTLSLLFYLCAALVYLKFVVTRSAGSYAGATVLFLLALGTKSVTATLPAALLVVLWWKKGTLQWRRDVLPLLPWFAAALIAGSTTAWVEQTLVGAKGAAFDLSFMQRLLLAGRNVWFYLGKLFWPSNLMFIYPRWEVASAAKTWVPWLVAAVLLTIVLWRFRRTSRAPLAAWLFFAGSLFPALGFFNVFPFLFSYVADHFQYLPSLGVFALAGTAIGQRATSPGGRGRRLAWVMFGGITAVLALLSNQQSRSYRDSETLYRTTLARNPACWMAHGNLGAELAKNRERMDEAMSHYQQALALKPDSSEVQNNYGNALAATGREAEAVAHFEAALRINPLMFEAELNLANTLSKLRGREADALAHFETALRLQPNLAEAHAGAAMQLSLVRERVGEAAAHFDAALRLAPNVATTHYNYALLLERYPERQSDAFAHYEEALRLNPEYVDALNNLGVLFAQHGQFDQARARWEAALRVRPDDRDARRNLDLLRQRQQR